MSVITANNIGERAWESLGSHAQGTVVGAPSRGIFLRFSERRNAFITNNVDPGPLTILAGSGSDQFKQIPVGAKVRIQEGEIRFSIPNLIITTSNALIWSAVPPEISQMDPAEVNARFTSIRNTIVRQRPDLQTAGMLGDILTGAGQNGVTAKVIARLQSADHHQLIEACLPLLGAGEGLTPWGDDIISGLMFLLNRWNGVLESRIDLAEFNFGLSELAYHHTTALSAELIECAGQGQADKRLVLAIDGIMTGNPAPDACANYLLDWGNSSGAAFLAGAAMAWQGSNHS